MSDRVRNVPIGAHFILKRTGDRYELLGHKRDTPGDAGFTAADMATAEARGFRDGVASVAANAGEPVAWRYVPSEVWENAVLTDDPERAEHARQNGCVVEPLYLAAPPTAQAEGWTKASKQLPPCREDQLYIGINTAGFAGVFNAVRVVNGNTYCLMEVAEESVSIMSDLAIWKPFNPPTSAEGVEHG